MATVVESATGEWTTVRIRRRSNPRRRSNAEDISQSDLDSLSGLYSPPKSAMPAGGVFGSPPPGLPTGFTALASEPEDSESGSEVMSSEDERDVVNSPGDVTKTPPRTKRQQGRRGGDVRPLSPPPDEVPTTVKRSSGASRVPMPKLTLSAFMPSIEDIQSAPASGGKGKRGKRGRRRKHAAGRSGAPEEGEAAGNSSEAPSTPPKGGSRAVSALDSPPHASVESKSESSGVAVTDAEAMEPPTRSRRARSISVASESELIGVTLDDGYQSDSAVDGDEDEERDELETSVDSVEIEAHDAASSSSSVGSVQSEEAEDQAVAPVARHSGDHEHGATATTSSADKAPASPLTTSPIRLIAPGLTPPVGLAPAGGATAVSSNASTSGVSGRSSVKTTKARKYSSLSSSKLITPIAAARAVCITLFDQPPHQLAAPSDLLGRKPVLAESPDEDDSDDEYHSYDDMDDVDGLAMTRVFVANEVACRIKLDGVNKAEKPWRALWGQVARLVPSWIRAVRTDDPRMHSPCFEAVTAAFEKLPWCRNHLCGIVAEVCHEYLGASLERWRRHWRHGAVIDTAEICVDDVNHTLHSWHREDSPGDGAALAELVQSFILTECAVGVPTGDALDVARMGASATSQQSTLNSDMLRRAKARRLDLLASALGSLCRSPYLLHSESVLERLCTSACRLVAAPENVGVGPAGRLIGRLASHWRKAADHCAIDAQVEVAWLRIVQSLLLCCPASASQPIPRGLPRTRGMSASRASPLDARHTSAVFNRIIVCMTSPHIAVSRAALELTANAFILTAFVLPSRTTSDRVAEALAANRKHWDSAVRDLSNSQFESMLDNR